MEKIDIIEVVKLRNRLQRQLEIENQRIDNNRSTPGQLEVSLENVKAIGKELKSMERILKEYGVFDTAMFAHFLADFLTLTEKSSKVTTFRMPKEKDGHIPTRIVVSDEITHDILRMNIHNKRDVEKYFSTPSTDTIIKFNGKKLYPFKKNLKMKEKFASHPRLKIAIYELMQLRIDHPELFEQELYDIVLDNTVTRNLNRSDAQYFEQKKRI